MVAKQRQDIISVCSEWRWQKGKVPTIGAYVVVVYNGMVWVRREEGRRMVDYLPHTTYLWQRLIGPVDGSLSDLDGVT